jgi:hypothetical protein
MCELFPTQLSTMQTPNLPHLRTSPILIPLWQPEHHAGFQIWWVLCISPVLLDKGSTCAIELWIAKSFHYCLCHLCALLGQGVCWLIALGNWVYQYFSAVCSWILT